MAVVWIPSLLRHLTAGQARVNAPGKTVGQVIEALEAAYPGLKDRLCQDDRLKPAIAVSVDGRLTRLGLLEAVGEQSEIHFLVAMAGG
jgi:molybdopterin synthase sulfur carrier subunit